MFPHDWGNDTEETRKADTGKAEFLAAGKAYKAVF